MITTDAAGCVTYLNKIAENLTGWTVAQARGQAVDTVFRIASERGSQLIENSASRCLIHHATISMAPRGILRARGGRDIDIEDSVGPIRGEDGTILGTVLVFHDISHEQRLRLELSWQATHEGQTGLINRREFEAQVGLVLSSA